MSARDHSCEHCGRGGMNELPCQECVTLRAQLEEVREQLANECTRSVAMEVSRDYHHKRWLELNRECVKARAKALEEAADIASHWPCNCAAIYKGMKVEHHGPDCPGGVGEEIADRIRALLPKAESHQVNVTINKVEKLAPPPVERVECPTYECDRCKHRAFLDEYDGKPCVSCRMGGHYRRAKP